MKYLEDLKSAIVAEDFYATSQVIEKIKQTYNAFDYLTAIFNIMENNPELDYGMPGPVVHFMESYYRKGYEELLLNSIRRFPTVHTIWMLNRVINDPNLKNKEMYLNELKSCLNRDDISQAVRNDINDFLNYQQNE